MSDITLVLQDKQLAVSVVGQQGPAGPPVPAGTNTRVLFSDNDVTGTDADFFYDKTTNTLSVVGAVQAGSSVVTPNLSLQNGAVYAHLYGASDASNTVEVRNSTAPTGFRVYNTFTDAANYERGSLYWSSGGLWLTTEKAGTGLARPLIIGTAGQETLRFMTNGLYRWYVTDAGGHLLPWTGNNNVLDLGGTGNQLRSGYFGTTLFVGTTDNTEWDGVGARLALGGANPAIKFHSADAGVPIFINYLTDVSKRLVWYNSTTNRLLMGLSQEGNLSLGITPFAWSSLYRAIDLESYSSVFSTTNTGASGMANNAYVNGAGVWSRKFGGFASLYQQDTNDGVHRWYSAASGLADSAVTWSQTMTLTDSGSLSVLGVAAAGEVNGAVLRTSTAYTVGTLPSAAGQGQGARAWVTDSSVAAAGNFGNVVATGGSNKVPVYSDGTNWRIG